MAENNVTAADDASTKTRNVLIAMDGSKHAIHAFEWYVENVYRPTDNVIMAHCAEHIVSVPPTALMAGNPAMIQSMIKLHEDQVMQVFRTIDQLANKHNIKHTLERLHGPPGEAIIKAAETQKCHMIVTGSRGQGSIRRTILGSVSDYLIHHAHIPVMVCKHEDEHEKLKQ